MERLTRQQRKIVELTKRGLRPKRDWTSSVHWPRYCVSTPCYYQEDDRGTQ